MYKIQWLFRIQIVYFKGQAGMLKMAIDVIITLNLTARESTLDVRNWLL